MVTTKQRDIKLDLDAFSIENIEGAGDELSVKVHADRTTKAGTPERYEIRFKFCRWGLMQLLTGAREMHARDRARIQNELARIEQEIESMRVKT